MKTPNFWKEKTRLSNFLRPLGWIYGLATAFRILLNKPKTVGANVICVGNLTAGGTGKTPVSVSIAKMLLSKGKKPFFITRGYGGKLSDTVVNNNSHTAKDVGDEPLLLSHIAPTVINPNRYLAAFKAVSIGADTIVMDDGFQNPTLAKDISLLVVDGNYGFGNERCIPAGPLREFASLGIKRADAIVLLGEDLHNIRLKTGNLPTFKGKIVPVKPNITNKNIIAFAGIGHPDKFFKSLQSLGFNLIQSISFGDHHNYSERELGKIINKAEKSGADIYTTSKDYVKIPTPLKKQFKVLEIDVAWEDKDALLDFILYKK